MKGKDVLTYSIFLSTFEFLIWAVILLVTWFSSDNFIVVIVPLIATILNFVKVVSTYKAYTDNNKNLLIVAVVLCAITVLYCLTTGGALPIVYSITNLLLVGSALMNYSENNEKEQLD